MARCKSEVQKKIQPMTWHPKMEVLFLIASLGAGPLRGLGGFRVDVYLPRVARLGVRSVCVQSRIYSHNPSITEILVFGALCLRTPQIEVLCSIPAKMGGDPT